MLVTYHNTIWHHNPEDLNLNYFQIVPKYSPVLDSVLLNQWTCNLLNIIQCMSEELELFLNVTSFGVQLHEQLTWIPPRTGLEHNSAPWWGSPLGTWVQRNVDTQGQPPEASVCEPEMGREAPRVGSHSASGGTPEGKSDFSNEWYFGLEKCVRTCFTIRINC